MSSATVSMEELLRAIGRARVYDVARRTPLDKAEYLSRDLGHQVLLKREDLQRTHTFKLRGAYNRIAHLDDDAAGVIAASAGNHAQGVSLAAQIRGLQATIVMPRTTPSIKVAGVERFGARIVLHGDNFDLANTHAESLSRSEGLTIIHPFDDLHVIAGQGTVGKEMLDEEPDLDVVFVPVGGGGLLAGVAAWIKHLHPTCRIVAVEPAGAACFTAARTAGHPVELESVDAFADGVAVRRIGGLSFSICEQLVDETITVDADEICAAIKVIFEETRSIAEPAGGLALAGLKRWVKQRSPNGSMTLAAIVSGANIDFHSLRHISERTEIGEHREAVFAVSIPERPGAFIRLCEVLGTRGVTEFNYRYNDSDEAHIYLGVQTHAGRSERKALQVALQEDGFSALDLSENETAKLHLRYLVGGRSSAAHERLFRFRFPERPGALLQFLKTIGSRWNISLFHYRNHGAAVGRILVGFQVPEQEYQAFVGRLRSTGYHYGEESDNPACQLFLGTTSREG